MLDETPDNRKAKRVILPGTIFKKRYLEIPQKHATEKFRCPLSVIYCIPLLNLAQVGNDICQNGKNLTTTT
jgi:hypothetical protein